MDKAMPNRIAFALAALLVLAGLAGCTTPEELRQYDAAQCRGYGFTPGTTDFAACLQRESLARRYAPPYWGPDWWFAYPHPPYH
jgi:hypothetical protein